MHKKKRDLKTLFQQEHIIVCIALKTEHLTYMLTRQGHCAPCEGQPREQQHVRSTVAHSVRVITRGSGSSGSGSTCWRLVRGGLLSYGGQTRDFSL